MTTTKNNFIHNLRDICKNKLESEQIMFIPEYTITPKTLNKIANIEYNRALVESANLLENFAVRLERDAKAGFIINSLTLLNELPNPEIIYKYVDGLVTLHSPIITNLALAYDQIENLSSNNSFSEKDVKYLHTLLSRGILPANKQGLYRNTRIESKVEPEAILAEINEMLDWYQGVDAKDTNPIIICGLLKGQLETVYPFEKYNSVIANLVARIVMRTRGIRLDRYLVPEIQYNTVKKDYEDALESIAYEDGDFTTWLEFYTGVFDTQTILTAEKVRGYAKDTKLAKVNGRIGLTERQNKLLEYLQDYGMLNNQQFEKLFPDISEDSVLRDLKRLIDLGLVVKKGKTKSSSYELR